MTSSSQGPVEHILTFLNKIAVNMIKIVRMRLVKLGPCVLTFIINRFMVFVRTCGVAALWMPSGVVGNI